MQYSSCILHGCSSVVSASEFKSKDPGFNPLVLQGEGQYFCPSRVNSCADLCVPYPHFVCTARAQIGVHVKDPISNFHKRVGLPAGGMVTQKYWVP